MTRTPTIRRTLALGAASVLTLWSAAPALADPGAAQGSGQGSGQASAVGHSRASLHGHADHPDHGAQGRNQGRNQDRTQARSEDASGEVGAQGHRGGNGDPAGNNGTVKIAPLGEMDRIPDNSPHPGCTFEVEWYGFDEGADIVSTVTFSAQAPTADAGLSVDGPSQVFVGGDPASGAGTDTGLDGRQAYTLSFTGDPHPKQGYHVRLTVATPRSQGNDTKTKVFWVAPCDSGVAAMGAGETGSTESTGGAGGAGGGDIEVLGEQASSNDTMTTGDQASASDDIEVLGEQATAPSQRTDGSVPTAVDAGEQGDSALADLVRSPWPMAMVGLGALLTVLAIASRRRPGARVDIQE